MRSGAPRFSRSARRASSTFSHQGASLKSLRLTPVGIFRRRVLAAPQVIRRLVSSVCSPLRAERALIYVRRNRRDLRGAGACGSCGLAALAAAAEQGPRGCGVPVRFVIFRWSYVFPCTPRDESEPSSAARRFPRRRTREAPRECGVWCDARGARGLRAVCVLLKSPRPATSRHLALVVPCVSSRPSSHRTLLPPAFTRRHRVRGGVSGHATQVASSSVDRPCAPRSEPRFVVSASRSFSLFALPHRTAGRRRERGAPRGVGQNLLLLC
jgi:hypothetical protein